MARVVESAPVADDPASRAGHEIRILSSERLVAGPGNGVGRRDRSVSNLDHILAHQEQQERQYQGSSTNRCSKLRSRINPSPCRELMAAGINRWRVDMPAVASGQGSATERR